MNRVEVCYIWYNKNQLVTTTGIPFLNIRTYALNPVPYSYTFIQEVSTVNLLQLVNPELLAVLVRFSRGSVEWNTHFDDPERQLYHNNKMKSKNERPAKQMKAMNLKEGSVYHLLLQD